MSSNNQSDNKYEDDVCYDAGEECSSGRAQSRSWHVRACRGPKNWRTEACDRETLYGPANFNGKPRPLENRRYKSKWAERKARRIEKPIPKNFYGYKKVKVELNWNKSIAANGVSWWRHPVNNASVYQDYEPKPITTWKWETDTP